MGKGVLILVLASSMAASFMYVSGDDAKFRRVEEEADYESKVLARETAESAFNLLIGKVKRDFDGYRGNYSDLEYGKSKYDIAAITGENSTVTLIATGKYGNYSYEITGSINRTGARLLDALTIDGPLSAISFANSATVSGVDTYPNGSDADGPDVHAILSTNSSAHSVVAAAAPSDRTPGVNGAKDLESGAPEVDLDDIESSIRNFSGDALMSYSGNQTFSNQTFGSAQALKVVRVEGGNVTLSGFTSGYGVLYLNGGNLTIQDSASWNGIIFVNQPSGGAQSFKNSASVYGAVILRTASNTGTPPDDDDGVGTGLPDGSFDIDVFEGATTTPVAHFDSYDDEFDVTGIDLLAAGCDPGFCWSNLVAGEVAEATVSFGNKSASSGTYDIRVGSTVYTGSTTDAINIKVDPSKVTKFDIGFTSLTTMRATTEAAVQGNTGTRDGAWSVKVMADIGCATKSGKSCKSEKSSKKSSKKSDKNVVVPELIYELAVYKDTGSGANGAECENGSKSAKSSKKSKKSCKSAKSDKSDKSSKKSDKSSKKSKKSSKLKLGDLLGGSDDDDEDDESGSDSIADGLICHAPPGNPGNKQSLTVGLAAIATHLAHGDVLGRCESDVYSEEGAPISVSMSNDAKIQYSSAAIKPIKTLLAQIAMEENGFAVRKVAETTAKLNDLLLLKR